MLPIKNLFGFRKNKGLDKSIIQKNPYRNNTDLNKRQFIKKGLFGLAGLGGLALASKIAKAGGLVFNDTSTQTVAGVSGINDNVITNGEMRVNQTLGSYTSGSPFPNNDDAWTVDRWLLLSDGNDIADVTTTTSGGVSGEDSYLRLDTETASKKFGIAQIIENDNCRHMLGGSQVVSLSFEAKVTNATKMSDIRAAVLTWDSTADSVTSDFVSAWGAEGSNFTAATNWTAENTPSNLGVTTSWGKYTIENIAIDTSGGKNIAVFIWQNNVATNDTTGVFLDITKVKLELGASATTFVSRDISTERDRCYRHRWNVSSLSFFPGRGDGAGATALFASATPPVKMFATPTAVLNSISILGYDTSGAESASSDAITSISVGNDTNIIKFTATTFIAMVDNAVGITHFQSGEMWFQAEM